MHPGSFLYNAPLTLSYRRLIGPGLLATSPVPLERSADERNLHRGEKNVLAQASERAFRVPSIGQGSRSPFRLRIHRRQRRVVVPPGIPARRVLLLEPIIIAFHHPRLRSFLAARVTIRAAYFTREYARAQASQKALSTAVFPRRPFLASDR